MKKIPIKPKLECGSSEAASNITVSTISVVKNETADQTPNRFGSTPSR
jgi:hypothetical protein